MIESKMENQMKPTQLVLATYNKGKSHEIRTLLKDSPIQIKDLTDFGPIPPVVEDGDTFDDNAYKKASFTSRILGLPAIADDSGLVVPALNGAPGVYSARFAGEDATDQQNCIKLLEQMKDVKDRKASFVCVVSIAIPTGPALTYEAQCDGLITETPSGSSGFGYDPVFFYPPKNKTFAELSDDEKNEVSHRGKAFLEIQSEMDKILIWLEQNMPRQAPIDHQH
jgi:XTP/dITP diphosphohydrolase